MNKYKFGFWNYMGVDRFDPNTAAQDWQDCAMNTPMSFNYNEAWSDKAAFLRHLDACAERSMKVIVCDSRTTFSHLKSVGKERFTADVKRAAADFGSHPAFLGFHVGDEPHPKDFVIAAEAYRICLRVLPDSTPFLNFMCYWEGCDDVACGVSNADSYQTALEKWVADAHAKMIGFDYYAHCAYYRRDEGIAGYFEWLHRFGQIARKHGVELVVTPLAVGHWMYAVPDEDMLRWQLSTAVAHGATWLNWFYLYDSEGIADGGGWRAAPIDVFGDRTDTISQIGVSTKTVQQAVRRYAFAPNVSARVAFELPYARYNRAVYDVRWY